MQCTVSFIFIIPEIVYPSKYSTTDNRTLYTCSCSFSILPHDLVLYAMTSESTAILYCPKWARKTYKCSL